jgi:hypothetical protein
MERSEILEAMGGLKLFGMKAAYDELIATAVKRQHEPQKVVGDLLTAELSEAAQFDRRDHVESAYRVELPQDAQLSASRPTRSSSDGPSRPALPARAPADH